MRLTLLDCEICGLIQASQIIPARSVDRIEKPRQTSAERCLGFGSKTLFFQHFAYVAALKPRQDLEKPMQALSEHHADYLENIRSIPRDIAALNGVVTHEGKLAFEYLRNDHLHYRKMRIENHDGSKTFRRDRKGAIAGL